MTSIIAISLVVLSSIIGATGGFIFKRASEHFSFSIEGIIKNYKLLLGFILFALASIIYIVALTKGDLNVLYPISSLTYIWSTLMAKAYLNEKINAYKWTGIALIVLGAVLIVR